MARTAAVLVEGVKDLRRDLRAIDKALPKELTKALKAAAEEVLPTARALAPKRSGRLASSLRASGAGNKASIRSPLPYANVQHWGGSVGRGRVGGRGGSTHINPTKFIVRAVDRHHEDVVDRLGDEIEALAERHGWK